MTAVRFALVAETVTVRRRRTVRRRFDMAGLLLGSTPLLRFRLG